MRQAEDHQNGQGNPLDAAIEWQIRLTSGHATEEDRFAHMAWLAESEKHLEAFERVKETWSGVDVARDAVLSEESVTVEGFNSAEQGGQKGSFITRLSGMFGRQNVPAALAALFAPKYRPAFAAAAVAIVVGVFVGLPPEETAPAPQQFASVIGNVSVHGLPDASSVTLDTDTRISAAYSETVRQLDLEEGIAFFDVATDPGRPFIVRAGVIQAEAVGTKFEVGRLEDELWVSVSEGQVRVSRLPGGARDESDSPVDPVLLSAGQQVMADMTGGRLNVQDVSTRTIGAWRYGHLIFNNARLDDVIKWLNRYADAQMLVLQDDSLASVQVNGVLFIDEPEVLAARLGDMLALELQVEDDVIRLTRANP